MRPRGDPSPALLRLAAAQDGVVSREQCLGLGLSPWSLARLVDHGHWQQPWRRLYLVGRDPPTWRALAWSGVLLAGGDAHLGFHSAGHLHGLLDAPTLIEVLVPHGRTVEARGQWSFPQGRTWRRPAVGAPPRTTIEDTVLDLTQRLDESAVLDLVAKAVQTRRTTGSRILARLEDRPRVRYRARLVAALRDITDGAESPLEIEYLREVERAHGLPTGRRQARTADGRFRDVEYEGFGLVVELDGRLGHEGLGRFRDMRRDNIALVAGSVTLRYGFVDVSQQPCLVAQQVAQVLQRCGWTGMVAYCPRCRPLAS